ncbi:MAG: HlyD family efflux transporter periplasmic adaptor subunit [Melioribacteraceae bacterium]|nr:HlyD family efflux transporter periplasmic adaptor subunit [Melioribacteraceae bacterium]
MKANKKVIIRIVSVIAILSIGFMGMNALGSSEKKSNKRESKPEIRTVEVKEINYSDINLEIRGNGIIESQRTLNLISEVSGRVVFAKNDLKTGTSAKYDEIILKIDSREAENKLRSYRSDFMNTVAALLPELNIEGSTVYNKWYQYFTSLDIDSEIPQLPEITDSQEKIQVSSRNIFTKYFSVKNQEIKVSKYSVKAPFTGYIKSSGIIKNSFVSIGTSLFGIEDITNLEIAVPLLVDEFNMIDFTKNPIVDIYGTEKMENKIEGRVVRNDTKLEKNSQTLNAYIQFKNYGMKPYFLPGNYVTVVIQGKILNDVAVIPRNIIDHEENIFYMEDGQLNKQKIELVNIQGENAIIKNSIPEGTKLVTTILAKPLIGMQIQTVEEANAANELKEEQDTSVALN